MSRWLCKVQSHDQPSDDVFNSISLCLPCSTFQKFIKFLGIFPYTCNTYINAIVILSRVITIIQFCYGDGAFKIAKTSSEQLHSTFHRPLKIIIFLYTFFMPMYIILYFYFEQMPSVSLAIGQGILKLLKIPFTSKFHIVFETQLTKITKFICTLSKQCSHSIQQLHQDDKTAQKPMLKEQVLNQQLRTHN